ncbi:MAG TPA: sulfotransferase [Alphaproteobacteria bacterium]|nr:sulfotransferase [Alphaproteobacteria bacterium]
MSGRLLKDCPWRPNLFVVGAPKCGTTSLCDYLRQHPDIFISAPKEPLFFCTDQVHEEPWRVSDPLRYLELFEPGAGQSWRGEGSVWYLTSEAAAQRIGEVSPDARIIIMLRNPVDMAASLHAQFVFSGNETIADFAEAYAAQEARALGRRMPRRAHAPAGLMYRDVGRYAAHVERYHRRFPPDQVKVLIFEEFVADLATGYRAVLEFLGVDPDIAPDFSIRNERHSVRSVALQRLLTKTPELWGTPLRARHGGRQPLREHARLALLRYNTGGARTAGIDEDLRRRLHGDFADDIARLEDLLGRDLSLWARRNLDGTAHAETAMSGRSS